MKPIRLDYSGRINGENGFADGAHKGFRMSYRFNKVVAGSILHWKSREYFYQIFMYSLETERRLIYSYCYQDEENWAQFCPEKCVMEWQQEDYVFKEDGYFRLLVGKVDGSPIEGPLKEEELFSMEWVEEPPYVWPTYFREECEKTVETVRKIQDEKSLSLMVLTDSHYVINGTWQDTAMNVQKTAEKITLDGVIHLGDLTDGMTPEAITKEYSGIIMDDLAKTGRPVYLCLGNHDSNYFKGNPERMSEEECSRWYLKQNESYYYVDLPEKRVRMYFLFSFDQSEQIRYGFPAKEVAWVKETLETVPEGFKVLIFSHVPPLPQIHYWSDAIRNGEELIKVLTDWHLAHENGVLAFVHGHNHAEQIYTECAFPIVSLGCNKLEDFKDKKPEGSYTCDRLRNTVTQDLWDVMVVHPEEGTVDFVRFGAGEDRHIGQNRQNIQ